MFDFENLIHGEKKPFFKKQLLDYGGGLKETIWHFNSLLGDGKQALLPQHDNSLTLAILFNEFSSRLTIIIMSCPL